MRASISLWRVDASTISAPLRSVGVVDGGDDLRGAVEEGLDDGCVATGRPRRRTPRWCCPSVRRRRRRRRAGPRGPRRPPTPARRPRARGRRALPSPAANASAAGSVQPAGLGVVLDRELGGRAQPDQVDGGPVALVLQVDDEAAWSERRLGQVGLGRRLVHLGLRVEHLEASDGDEREHRDGQGHGELGPDVGRAEHGGLLCSALTGPAAGGRRRFGVGVRIGVGGGAGGDVDGGHRTTGDGHRPWRRWSVVDRHACG